MKKLLSGSLQTADGISLSDDEIEDLVGYLWENIDGLPGQVQELLYDSQQPGKNGAVSYALLAGWALGKFDYRLGDPWLGNKSGWVAKEKDVN